MAAAEALLRPRAAYRAVYLASPLKFHTVLHAFQRYLPRYNIDPWQKDPHAPEKHKWHTRQERRRGRWNYRYGPLSGVQLPDWPDPGLLGSAGLVQVAAKAQAERLQDYMFWHQVAERAYKLRDVLSVGDLAGLLDALVTADHRHLQLMKTLCRELIDDADKLAFVEVAVIANAYAHFNCFNRQLLEALAHQATLLLSGEPPPYAPSAGDLDADVNSLAVLLKAFVTLSFHTDELLHAVNTAAVQKVDSMPFSGVVDVISGFLKLGRPFEAGADFWASVTAKVPNSRMASLCPAFLAMAQLGLDEPRLREALIAEIVRGVREVQGQALQLAPPTQFSLLLGEQPEGTSSSSASSSPWPETPFSHAPEPRLPAFAAPQAPAELLGLFSKTALPSPTPAAEQETGLVEFFAPFGEDDQEPIEFAVESATPSRSSSPPRWYSAVSRCMLRPRTPGYLPFSATDNFTRNRRGERIGEALSGLRTLWRSAPGALPARPSDRELELASAAIPVLRTSLQGIGPAHLVDCAELYAMYSEITGEGSEEVMRDIVREALRKLSNFSPQELKRIRAAALRAGVDDPYLERARRRRFPKALRKELRDEEAAAAGTPAPDPATSDPTDPKREGKEGVPAGVDRAP